jgi:hypothetical protein
MASLSGLKRFGGTPSPPSRAPSIASWRGMPSRPGAGFSAFSFVCVVIPPQVPPDWKKGEVLLDFREIS